jgi:hypothetical protein
LSLPLVLGFVTVYTTDGYSSFGTLYKVLRAEKKEHEVYTTLLLFLYILDTIEASILLAMGSVYLNLY